MPVRHVATLLTVATLVLGACGAGAAVRSPGPTSARTAAVTPAASPSLEPTPGPTALAARPTVDPNYSGFETIAFGIGGTECHLGTIADTFAPTDPIRVNVAYTPDLPAGTTVTIHLTRGGIELKHYPQTLSFDSATHCIFGSVFPDPLSAGHYRFEVVPDTAPSVADEFDVK